MGASSTGFGRRSVLLAFVVGLLTVLWLATGEARAELQVDITRGHVEPLPVAVPDFYGETPEEQKIGRNIAAVISRNLEFSGLFRPVSSQAFIEKVGPGTLAQPRFADWRVINAQALVTGKVTLGPGQRSEL